MPVALAVGTSVALATSGHAAGMPYDLHRLPEDAAVLCTGASSRRTIQFSRLCSPFSALRCRSRTAVAPLERLKILMQIQGNTKASNYAPSSMHAKLAAVVM